MENIFFLVLLAIVGLVRWLSQVAEEKKNAEAEKRARTSAEPGGVPTPVQRAPAQTEEERIRRFMEALGVPTTSPPPPPVQPRKPQPPPQQPERKFLPVDPFPVPQARRAEQPPPVSIPTTPAIPVAPAPVPPPVAPPPLPTRETTVFAEPIRQRVPQRSVVAEFEVQDVTGAAADDLQPDAASSTRRSGARTEARGIAARLGTAQGLRDAVVLREIFGPPRSMQPNDRQTVG